jgi:hypothetical protein
MPYPDQDIERLLANGHLSGRAYDRIEERVMERVAPRRRVPRLRWLLAAALPAVTAVGGLVFFLGRTPPASNDGGGFREKGSEPALAGAVELRCSTERSCRVGDTLLFLVNTDVIHGYLNVSAQRISPPSPERIRFFPTESGDSPRVEAARGTIVLEKGIRLGPSLSPGIYRVDLRWTDGAASPDPSAGRGTSVELRIDE